MWLVKKVGKSRRWVPVSNKNMKPKKTKKTKKTKKVKKLRGGDALAQVRKSMCAVLRAYIPYVGIDREMTYDEIADHGKYIRPTIVMYVRAERKFQEDASKLDPGDFVGVYNILVKKKQHLKGLINKLLEVGMSLSHLVEDPPVQLVDEVGCEDEEALCTHAERADMGNLTRT
jgi:hypothetical protein